MNSSSLFQHLSTRLPKTSLSLPGTILLLIAVLCGQSLWPAPSSAATIAAGKTRTIVEPQPTAPPTSRYIYQETFNDAQSRAQTIFNSQDIDWNVDSGQLTLAKRHNRLQQDPLVVTDGSAHTYLVWQDLRTDDGDIYAQRIDTNGNPLWPVNQRVNKAADDTLQSSPAAAIDSTGNLVVAWVDRRDRNERIYAQQLNSAGEWRWFEDIIVSAGGESSAQGAPAMVIDGADHITIVWHDNRLGDYDIFAQQLDREGLRQWENDQRINQDSSLQSQVDPVIARTSGGNNLIIWLDQRVGNRDIYAQQLTSDGRLEWAQAVQINPTTSAADNRPALATATNGSGVIAWQNNQSGAIALQTVLPDGQLGWATPKTISPRTAVIDMETTPGLLLTTEGITLIWLGIPSGQTDRQLYIQQLDSAGNTQQQTPLIEQPSSGDFAQLRRITPARLDDGQLLVVWPWQQNDGQRSIQLQALTPALVLIWPTPHVLNDRLGSVDQRVPAIATTKQGDTIVVWQDQRAEMPGLYVQRLDEAGNLRWRESIRTHRQPLTQRDQLVPAVGVWEEDAYVVWSDTRTGQPRIYLQRIDALGNRAWATAHLVSRIGEAVVSQINPMLKIGSDGTMIVIWEEIRESQRLILGQRMTLDGQPQWTTDLVISEQSTSGRLPNLALDGQGNSTVVWGVTTTSGTDLWAVRIDSNGNRLWQQPVQVNQFSGLVDRFNPPAITAIADGSTALAWVDRRERAIYAQRLESSGSRLWANDQLLSTTTTGGAPSPTLAALTGDLFVAAWQGITETGEQTIVTQFIDGMGAISRPITGTAESPVSAQIRDGYYPRLATHADGSFVVAWQEERAMNPDVYLQRLNGQGQPQWEIERTVVSKDQFYVSQGTLQSNVIDTTAFSITHALLDAVISVEGVVIDRADVAGIDAGEAGGTVAFQLSNDDGQHWADVELGVMHIFTTTGSALRWQSRLTVDPLLRNRSPAIDTLTIAYAAAFSPTNDRYEPDDTCRTATAVRLDGAPQQHQLSPNQQLDQDWFALAVTAGQSYTLLMEPERHIDELSVAIYADCLSAIKQRDTLLQGGVHQVTFSAATDTTYYALVTYTRATPTLPPLSYAVTLHQQRAPGLAIIVAGPTRDETKQSLATAAADQVYQTLLQHGHTADTIAYLTAAAVTGADSSPTRANLETALQRWAPLRTLTSVDPLLLYLVGEVDNGMFQLQGDDQLTVETLDHWLTNLETTTPIRTITLITEGSTAGTFLVPGGPNRLWIASTNASAVAWSLDKRLLFSEIFWATLHQGYSLQRGFQLAQMQVQISGCAVTATAACQVPWLEDSGDGKPNGALDGRRAWRLQLGAPTTTLPQIVGVVTLSDSAINRVVDTDAESLSVAVQVLYPATVSELHAYLIQPSVIAQPTDPLVAFPTLTTKRITLTPSTESAVSADTSPELAGPITEYRGTFTALPANSGILVIGGTTQSGLPILPHTQEYYGEHTIFLPVISN